MKRSTLALASFVLALACGSCQTSLGEALARIGDSVSATVSSVVGSDPDLIEPRPATGRAYGGFPAPASWFGMSSKQLLAQQVQFENQSGKSVKTLAARTGWRTRPGHSLSNIIRSEFGDVWEKYAEDALRRAQNLDSLPGVQREAEAAEAIGDAGMAKHKRETYLSLKSSVEAPLVDVPLRDFGFACFGVEGIETSGTVEFLRKCLLRVKETLRSCYLDKAGQEFAFSESKRNKMLSWHKSVDALLGELGSVERGSDDAEFVRLFGEFREVVVGEL